MPQITGSGTYHSSAAPDSHSINAQTLYGHIDSFLSEAIALSNSWSETDCRLVIEKLFHIQSSLDRLKDKLLDIPFGLDVPTFAIDRIRESDLDMPTIISRRGVSLFTLAIEIKLMLFAIESIVLARRYSATPDGDEMCWNNLDSPWCIKGINVCSERPSWLLEYWAHDRSEFNNWENMNRLEFRLYGYSIELVEDLRYIRDQLQLELGIEVETP
jgi:hypothetical protein